MDFDMKCNDFKYSNTSSSIDKGIDDLCEKLPEGVQAKPQISSLRNVSENCGAPSDASIANTSLSSISSGLTSQNYSSTMEPLVKLPNISYELGVAKAIMQQQSSISGDNLFDHLSDLIKRVIDERPPNVIDFFEEFSRNVREQKFHLPERFPPDAVFEEKRSYKLAKKQLISMKLPYPTDMTLEVEDEIEEERSKHDNLKPKNEVLNKFRTFNDRVQYLQFYWNQCGFSIGSEDIFQLACSMNRLQTHPSIMQCRFWGMIKGLKASYYIVEASLSNFEYQTRLLQMEAELQGNLTGQSVGDATKQKQQSHIGPELTPGAVGWENYPEEDILKMKPEALPVPSPKKFDAFDIPPEPIGRGVNRFSYFVVNTLTDEWIELPITTPRQISLSRHIKKFFTGDLEEEIVSYPYFGGKEKHYLRAMIARITAGTYIAPKNYYRKMTKKERRLFEGQEDNEEEDDDEEEEEEESQMSEDVETDNDIVLLKNEMYDASAPLKLLNNTENWVHVRPNILLQGRVVWFNQQKAEREREKEHNSEKMSQPEKSDNEESDQDEYSSEDEEDDEEKEMEVNSEKGPAILTTCSHDKSDVTPVPWVGRFNSKFTNQNERILIMQSNVWPGAYSFVYKDLCESTYLGWGHKVVARNMSWKHLPPIEEEYKHKSEDFIETIDPSIELEEAYQLSLLKNELTTTKEHGYDKHEALESSDDKENDDYEEDD